MSEDRAEADRRNRRKKNFWLVLVISIFLIAGLIWLLYWIFFGRFYVTTKDAYIHGNTVFLTPQVSGIVKNIYADDTFFVEEGQLLVALDPTDYLLKFEESKANLGLTARQVAQFFENVKEQEATVALRLAELTLAELELCHRENLVQAKAVSLEEYEIAATNVATAEANLVLAERTYERACLLVDGTTVFTHPQVAQQASIVRDAYINLLRCNLYSPVTGYVAKRSVQVGKEVAPGETLLTVVPLYDLWAEANFKETQLTNVRIGQSVTFTTDIYRNNVKYYGTVVGFSPGTGDAFALLPPQNASGNWIKIIQRLPVRISIDPQALRENPLMIGLSLHVSVDVRDATGKILSPVPIDGFPFYKTGIFDWQDAFCRIDADIEDIIRENASCER